jgi:hypothetical protein
LKKIIAARRTALRWLKSECLRKREIKNFSKKPQGFIAEESAGSGLTWTNGKSD